MSGLPPFIDDRSRGLEEEAAPAFVPAGSLMPHGGAVDHHSEYDAAAMTGQLEIACRHGAMVERAAACHGILPSIVAGLCSRRSGWGMQLSPCGVDGTRDFQDRAGLAGTRTSPLPPDGLGFERGLMALDYDLHPLARGLAWRDPESNVDAALLLIATYSTRLRRRTTLQGTGLLRASIAAFECGVERVERAVRLGLDVDSVTPCWAHGARGCGQDVLERAAFFQAEGWD